VGQCNYDCSYCVQKRETRRGLPTAAELELFLSTWDELPGSWELKISGGEPFVLKQLPAVAERLRQRGHLVSILTNLSAPSTRLEAFINGAGDALRTFSTSLHREMVTEEEFLEKVLWVGGRLRDLPRATLVVNAVLDPAQLDALLETQRVFEGAGVKFYPQMMRVGGRNYHYSDGEWEKVRRLVGEKSTPREVNQGYSFRGEPCWAGARYFIVTHRGKAFSCYPGKRFGDGFLGNVLQGTFRLWEGPRPCPYEVCPCTVPQNRGIVEAKLGVRLAEPLSPQKLGIDAP
jgi:organic radical activating enzyme